MLAVALCALVQTSMQANNLLVLPAFQSTTTGDGIVFDGLTLQRLSTFTADTAAFAVLTRPTLQPDDARYFVISSSGSNSITTLDKDFKVVGSPLSLGQNVRGAAVSPDGRRLVTTYGQTNLKIFNAADTSEIQTQFIDVGLDPSDVVFTVDSKRIFVLSVAAQRVTAVDLDPSPRVVGSIQLAGTTSTTPGSLTIGPNGLIYVSVESRVLEIDPRGSEINGTNIRRQFNFSNGAKVGKLSFTPDGTRAVAVNLNAAASGDIFYFFHLDLLNGGNASSVVKNTDVLTGLLFDKVFTVSNTRAYAITSKLSTKQRGLYELTLPASGNIARRLKRRR
ncbi:MAG: YncE family protein [Bryobacteraceae bacterium]